MKTIAKRNNNYSIFSDLINDDFLFPTIKAKAPMINLKETESEYIVEVAAPGYKKDSFNIEIKDEYLIISSKNENSKEEKNNKYHKKEFSYSSFEKSFILPETANVDDIKASYNEGVLSISLPKKEKIEKIKKVIEIQ